MKRIFIGLLLLLFAKTTFAQKDSLSFNEQNKYIYYHVVEQPGSTVDTLQTRALYFLKSAYPKTRIDKSSEPANITGNGIFLVYSGTTLVKSQDGQISYSCTIECKDQKYRYWLTDFVYTPYKTDRYGNSVPELGGDIALENAKKFNKGQADNYLNQAGAFSKQFGDKLKQYMLKVSSATPIEAI
jgi:hypothetical protein